MKKLEERLSRLEEIAEEIRGEVSIEDAMALFEEGIKLAKGLEKEIDKIEGKVEILLNQPEKADDKVELGLFDQE
jgi:exodeoxyribonuclease VII small subunit